LEIALNDDVPPSKKATAVGEVLKAQSSASALRDKGQSAFQKALEDHNNSPVEQMKRESLGGTGALAEAMKAVGDGFASKLSGIADGPLAQNDAFREAMNGFAQKGDDLTKSLANIGIPNTALSKAMEGIARQNKLIEQLDRGPLLPAIGIEPILRNVEALRREPNPIHETNDRLAELDERLETMTSILGEGIKIAASLQEAGLESAKAAADNANTARRTIWLTGAATFAAIVALIVPFVQQHFAAKENERQQDLVLQRLTDEFARLKTASTSDSENITNALESAETAIVDAIREGSSREATTKNSE
jgi:hypothetical protein